MQVPFTKHATELPRFANCLNNQQQCVCGKTVRLGDVYATWIEGKDGWGYYAVCNAACWAVHMSQGSA